MPGTQTANGARPPQFPGYFNEVTGLPNHQVFVRELASHVAKWQRHPRPLALALLDIDHFQKLKARSGDGAGEAVLRAVANAVCDTLRFDAFLAHPHENRLDQFAIVLENVPLPDVQQLLRGLLGELRRNRIPFRGSVLRVTFSVGLAELRFDEQAENFATRAADALYCSKRAGRDCAYLHDGERPLSIDLPFSNDGNRPEQRSSQRYPFEHVQLLGPAVAGHVPVLSELRPFTCHDLSATGFSYFAHDAPQSKSLVLVLGTGSARKFMTAKVVRCQLVDNAQQFLFRIGCQFSGRIQ